MDNSDNSPRLVIGDTVNMNGLKLNIIGIYNDEYVVSIDAKSLDQEWFKIVNTNTAEYGDLEYKEKGND